MKRQMRQSNSTILEDDTGFHNHPQSSSQLPQNNPFKNNQSQFKERKGSDKVGQIEEGIISSNGKSFFKYNGVHQSLEQQLLLSGGVVVEQRNKDFAGETFSQISSTFDQNMNVHQQVSNQNFYKIQNIGQADKILISANEYSHNNQDELLDDEILNKSSSFERSQEHKKAPQRRKISHQDDLVQLPEISQRISFLENAYYKQQEEINKLANRNEDLKREKQLLSKKYEKRMVDIEQIIKVILQNLKEDPRSVDKHSKINHSFSIGYSYSTLLQPESHKMPKNIEREKENLLNPNESNEGGSVKRRYKIEGKSLQSQLLNLKRMIKEFKKTDIEQQSCVDQSQKQNSLENLWNHIISYKHQDEEQQSQNFVPQDSLASVNQAFIESSNTRELKSSKNNTSFFGKEWQNELKGNERIENTKNQNQEDQNLRNHVSEEELIFFKDKVSDLSCTQQQKFIELFWLNKLQNEEKKDKDRRDVKLEEILEISKTINNSAISSFRTGRQNQNGLVKRSSKDLHNQQQQNSFINLLKQFNSNENMSNDQSQININQQKGDKNNSTLEISFNQNEIQTVDGQQQEVFKDKKFLEVDNSIQKFLKLDDKTSQRDINKNNYQEEQKKAQNDNNRMFGSMEGSIDLQMGGIAESIRNDQSLDKELKEFGDIFAKKSQQMFDFPDYSVIEGNSIEHKKEKNSFEGSIEKQEGGSDFLVGDSLVSMNDLFRPDKKDTQPMPIMTIKVQDREIKMPQLNLKRAIDLEKREPYKFQQVSGYHSSPSSKLSASHVEQPSSFQNESISKQNIGTVLFKDSSNHEDLDQAVIEEEVKSDKSESQEKQNSNGQLQNIFGSLKKEIQNEDKKDNDDTLDLNDIGFSGPNSNEKELPKFKASQSNSKEKESKIEIQILSNEDDVGQKDKSIINQSQNMSVLKKSLSESHLINLSEVNMVNEDLKRIENESVPENLNFLDSNKEQESEQVSKNGQINFKKIKTPKNALKFNFNQLNQNQGLQFMVKQQQQQQQFNHSKKRSTSSETRKIIKVNRQDSGKKGKNIKVISYNDEEDSKQGSDKKSIKLKGNMIKVNKIGNIQNLNVPKKKFKVNPNQLSMIQPSANEISCDQDQPLVANSFFYHENNYNSIGMNQLEEIKEDQEAVISKGVKPKQSRVKIIKRQKNEEESKLVSKPDGSQLTAYNDSAALVSYGSNIIVQKTKKSTSIKKHNPYQEQINPVNDNTFSRASNISSVQQKQTINSCEFELAQELQEKYPSQNSPFLESPPKNQRQSKSLVNSKRVAVVLKTRAGDNKQIGMNQVKQKRLSVQRRRVQDIDKQQQNDPVNQTEIYDIKNNQSVIHKHSFNMQNVSHIIQNPNESLMINKTQIEDNSIIGGNGKKIIKIAMRSNERKVRDKLKYQQNIIQQQHDMSLHQPQIQLSNVSINEGQLTSQKSFPKFFRQSQKTNPQPYQTNEEHSKSIGTTATKVLQATTIKGVSQDKHTKKKHQESTQNESVNQSRRRPNSSKLRKKSGTSDTMQMLKNYKQPRKTTNEQLPLSQVSSMKNL